MNIGRSNKALEFHLTSPQVPRKPHHNASQLQRWLEKCVSHHWKCSRFQRYSTDPNQRPTRVLMIEANLVKLKCDFSHIQSPYATLSHMWGTDSTCQLMLTEANMAECENGIARAVLPPIYREAVELAQSLNLAYLWIDSLCIVQDSPSDWEHEASLMASVYGNALCNLACIFPPTHVQPEPKLDPRAYIPCVLDSATSQKPGIYAIRDTLQRERQFDGFACDHDHKSWPLSSRAWTFQEYLLCPRVIYFGHDTLIWDCLQGERDEWLGKLKGRFRSSSLTKERLNETMWQSIQKAVDSYQIPPFNVLWNDIISEYRSRALTKSDDRVIAIAGIACAIRSINKFTYLAGHWSNYMTSSLLWHVIHHEGTPASSTSMNGWVTEPVTNTVPTWSWFSVPIGEGSSFQLRFMLDVLKCHPDLETFYQSRMISFKWPSTPPNELPPSSYFDFAGLELTLRVQHCRAPVDYTGADTMRAVIDKQFKEPNIASANLTYYPDKTHEETPPPWARFALLVENQHTEHSNRWRGYVSMLAGLCIIKPVSEGHWQRVGVWELAVQIRFKHPRWKESVFRFMKDVRDEEITLV